MTAPPRPAAHRHRAVGGAARLAAPALVLGLTAGFGAVPAGAQLGMDVGEQLSGEKGRVIMLDASGSMRSTDDYPTGSSRFRAARDVLTAEVQDLVNDGDGRETAVMVFGSTLSWAAEQRRTGRRPDDVTPDEPLCQDISMVVDFTRPDDLFVGEVIEKSQPLIAQGMTPIHLSIMAAMEKLDPDVGGEIVLISDMEELYCLPQGKSVCDALRAEFPDFSNMAENVNIVVYEVPSTNLKGQLEDCFQTTTIPLSTTNPDPANTVNLRDELVPITFSLAWSQPVLGTAVPGSGSVRYVVTDAATGDDKHNSAVARLELEAGRYDVAVVDRDVIASLGFSASGTGRTVEIPVAPGGVRIRALDLDTRQPFTDPFEVVIEQVVGTAATEIERRSMRSGAAPLLLGQGTFQIRGTTAGGQVASSKITISIDEIGTVDLLFESGPPSTRAVTLEVLAPDPTFLPPSGYRPPSVTIEQDGRTIAELSPGRNTFDVAPGSIDVVVKSDKSPAWSMPIEDGTDPLSGTIELNPGYVEATAPDAGTFRLYDGSGDELGVFTGEAFAQSLPEGNYSLTYAPPGGDEGQPARFRIYHGERTELTF
ncbi:MAG: VWA domain-containing protein [Pseudomonadota bacterium]